MITLNIPPKKQAIIEQASREAGVSVEQYIISKVLSNETAHTPQTTANKKSARVLGFMQGEITVPDDIHWGDDAVLAEFDTPL